jgi:hypothetical protein
MHRGEPRPPTHTTMATFIQSDWGTYMRRGARAAAALLVLLYVIAADLVVLTYSAGYSLGTAVHQLNDRIAGIKHLPPAPPAIHPLVAIADQLDSSLTVRELRIMTGNKRGRKAQLIEALVVG